MAVTVRNPALLGWPRPAPSSAGLPRGRTSEGLVITLSSPGPFIHSSVRSLIHACASRGCMHRADTWRSGDPLLLREVGVSMTTIGQTPNAETFLPEASDGGGRYCNSLPARLPAPALVPSVCSAHRDPVKTPSCALRRSQLSSELSLPRTPHPSSLGERVT